MNQLFCIKCISTGSKNGVCITSKPHLICKSRVNPGKHRAVSGAPVSLRQSKLFASRVGGAMMVKGRGRGVVGAHGGGGGGVWPAPAFPAPHTYCPGVSVATDWGLTIHRKVNKLLSAFCRGPQCPLASHPYTAQHCVSPLSSSLPTPTKSPQSTKKVPNYHYHFYY